MVDLTCVSSRPKTRAGFEPPLTALKKPVDFLLVSGPLTPFMTEFDGLRDSLACDGGTGTGAGALTLGAAAARPPLSGAMGWPALSLAMSATTSLTEP